LNFIEIEVAAGKINLSSSMNQTGGMYFADLGWLQ
jgi:hypothetical protein